MPNEAKVCANAAGGLLIWHITLNDWVGILTMIYLGLCVILTLPKFPKWWNDMREYKPFWQALRRLFRRGRDVN